MRIHRLSGYAYRYTLNLFNLNSKINYYYCFFNNFLDLNQLRKDCAFQQRLGMGKIHYYGKTCGWERGDYTGVLCVCEPTSWLKKKKLHSHYFSFCVLKCVFFWVSFNTYPNTHMI